MDHEVADLLAHCALWRTLAVLTHCAKIDPTQEDGTNDSASFGEDVSVVVCVKSCKLIMGSGKAIPAEPPSLFHKH